MVSSAAKALTHGHLMKSAPLYLWASRIWTVLLSLFLFIYKCKLIFFLSVTECRLIQSWSG